MKFHSDWKFTQWQSVERVANNDLTRVVALVPIIGYLILFNDQIAEIASFRVIAGVEPGAETPFFLTGVAKMRLVFFGSLLLLFSNLIFKAFRPHVLELAKGDIEFAARVSERYSVHELADMETHVFSDYWKPRLPLFWKVLDELRSKKPVVSGYRPDVRNAMFNAHGDYISYLSREWWTGEMHTFRLARVASLSLGIAGIFLLAIPTLDITQAVVGDVLLKLW
ncbi:hypothetical protein HW561_13855 [Rhodobacteraceae bacterium B1Z28]|uniref:SMODS and SLOG-associating 2TM effector domain-containing protein n=1 Tax=Ruegeria haliotis TaxID=2747601 RepID=A0ABX2PRU7_9RHOB|nr:hypothetical protein [Ruegeria haliotis]NVO56874.1 hypothetical protein [Ruegeria haliotis]